MKVILTSEFHHVADKLLAQGHIDGNQKKVAFIQNATDSRRDAGELEISRVEAGKEWYRKNGFDVEIIDLRIIQGEILEQKLKTSHYLHIHGGDIKRIAKLAIESGLYDIINNALQDGLVYIGSSAGTILAGSSIDYAFIGQTHPSTVETDITKGFGLHPFFIVPHSNREGAISAKQQRLEYCETHAYSPYLTLSDTQAIVIEDGKFEFI